MSPLSRLLLTPWLCCCWLFVHVDKYCVVSRRTVRAGLRASTRACTSKATRSSSCPDRCENTQESFPLSLLPCVYGCFDQCACIAPHVLVLLVTLVATAHATPACSTHKVLMYACGLVPGLPRLDVQLFSESFVVRPSDSEASLSTSERASDSRYGRTVCAQPWLTFHATQVQHFQDEVRPFCRLYRVLK
jgi:hypothetical protein